MKLYNRLTRSINDLKPLKDNLVRIYSCGPTVYDHAHIGNLSSFIFADTLRRAIKAEGFKVQQVMNYTDVDDKIIRRSQEIYPDNTPYEALEALTSHYIALFDQDMRSIGNDSDDITFLRATESIPEMQRLITELLEKGVAYIAEDGVYFSIEAYQASGKIYGQLLKITAKNTSSARILNDEYDKETIHDFALWKKQKPSEPAWEFTVEGQDLTGRPGWHIECSAMSREALGQPFDIHTGGIDLLFPHHENEIAQSTAGQKNPVMASIFMHNEHILVDNKKMSKSAKNFYTLTDIIDKGYDPLAFRLMVLQAQYRNQVNFSWQNLEAASERLKTLRAFAVLRWQASEGGQRRDWKLHQRELLELMSDDLKTPAVLAKLSSIADTLTHKPSAAQLKEFTAFLQFLDELLGLKLFEQPDVSDEVKRLIAQRETARNNKEFAAADAIRHQLLTQHIELRDTSNGALWNYRQ